MSKRKIECPICGAEIIIDSYYGDGDHILHEENGSCPGCKYFYEYSYGYTSHFFNGLEFFWSYNDTEEYKRKQYNDLLEYAKTQMEAQ